MGPRYSLVDLVEPVVRGGAVFQYMIRRNYETTMEDAGAAVFYFMELSEGRECLESLLSH